MEKWGIEVLFAGIYLFGGACVLVYAIRRGKPIVLVVNAILLIAVAWVFSSKGMRLRDVTLAMAVLLLAAGIHQLVRRSSGEQGAEA